MILFIAVWFFTVRNSLLKQQHVNNIETSIIIDTNLPIAAKRVSINPKSKGGNVKFIAGAGRIQGYYYHYYFLSLYLF
jgi:hypothetical protein